MEMGDIRKAQLFRQRGQGGAVIDCGDPRQILAAQGKEVAAIDGCLPRLPAIERAVCSLCGG